MHMLQIIKRDRKSYIINVSKEYSIVSQFTSFVAIEKREKVWTDITNYLVDTCWQDEKFDQSKGPSMAELVDKENVDTLQYMGWEIDQSKDLSKVTSSFIIFVHLLLWELFELYNCMSKLFGWIC